MNSGVYYVVELLKSFTNKELKDLQAIANCSYFNTEKKIIRLLNFLIEELKYGEILSENNLASIYNTLYDTKLRSLNTKERSKVYGKMSLLYDLVQQFLMIDALQEKEKTKAFLLQEQLLNKRQHRNFKKHTKAQRKILQQTELDAEFYEHQFIIEQGVLRFAQLTGSLNKENNIGLIKDSLTLYYILHQMDLYFLELYLNEITSSYQASFTYYSAIEPLLKLPQFANHSLLLVYQSAIKLMETKTDSAFLQLSKDLEINSTALPIDSSINFYNVLLNFCVTQIRKGKKEYNQQQFELYKIMDEKNLLLTNNQIQISNLLGAIAYYKKDYQLAIDYLFPLPAINQTYDINRRSIMIKAFYELDTDFKETTHTLFRSFEKFIREHKNLPSKSKTSYRNFSRTLINLYRIKHNVTKMKLENLKQKLIAQKLNSNKSWLLEKIKELS